MEVYSPPRAAEGVFFRTFLLPIAVSSSPETLPSFGVRGSGPTTHTATTAAANNNNDHYHRPPLDHTTPTAPRQQRPGSIDAGGANLRMKSGHEKVVTTDSTPADMARAAGVPLDAAAAPAAPEVVRSTDKVSYKM